MQVTLLQKPPGEQATASKFVGLSALAPKAGHLSRCENCERTAQGHLTGARTRQQLVEKSGLTAYGDGWFVANKKFFYNGLDKGAIKSDNPVIVKFNDKFVILSDNFDYRIETDTLYQHQSQYPAGITGAVVHQNRIFAISGGTLHACNLGDERNWEDFQNDNGTPKETGSYKLSVADGDFTAITGMGKNIVLFQGHTAYELYGSRPSNFTLTKCLSMGVTGPEKVAADDNNLYYIAHDRLWRYRGGAPVDVLEPFGLKMEPDTALCLGVEGLFLFDSRGVFLFDGTGLLKIDGNVYTAPTAIRGDVTAIHGHAACRLLSGGRSHFQMSFYTGLCGGNLEEYLLRYRGEITVTTGDRMLARKTGKTVSSLRCFISRGMGDTSEITVRGAAGTELLEISSIRRGGDDT